MICGVVPWRLECWPVWLSGKDHHLDSFQKFFRTVKSQIIYVVLVLNDKDNISPLISVE